METPIHTGRDTTFLTYQMCTLVWGPSGDQGAVFPEVHFLSISLSDSNGQILIRFIEFPVACLKSPNFKHSDSLPQKSLILSLWVPSWKEKGPVAGGKGLQTSKQQTNKNPFQGGGIFERKGRIYLFDKQIIRLKNSLLFLQFRELTSFSIRGLLSSLTMSFMEAGNMSPLSHCIPRNCKKLNTLLYDNNYNHWNN